MFSTITANNQSILLHHKRTTVKESLPHTLSLAFTRSINPECHHAVYQNTDGWIPYFFLLRRQHMFESSPLFSVVCKAEFVPVGWKSNEGKSRCSFAAVDCAAPSLHHPLYWLRAPDKTDAQFVVGLQRSLHPSFFQEFTIRPGFCLIVVNEGLLFVQWDVLEAKRIHPKRLPPTPLSTAMWLSLERKNKGCFNQNCF